MHVCMCESIEMYVDIWVEEMLVILEIMYKKKNYLIRSYLIR